MKITFSISGIIGFSIILILLSIIFQRIYKQNNIFEKFNNPNDTQYDYIINTVNETLETDDKINKLENEFIIPTFTDYYDLYKKTKDKINENNPVLDKFIIDQHLQDTQIIKLKNEITNLNNLLNQGNNNNNQGNNNNNNCPNPLNQKDNAIKSIKSLKYGISLNTHQQSNSGKKPLEPNSEDLPNNCQSYPTYEPVNPEKDPLMIYINQGCLTYSIDGKNISDDTRKLIEEMRNGNSSAEIVTLQPS
jgi:hypothetical protein